MSARVVVLDYGSGNVHSAVRMLERVGADVELTADPQAVLAADGLFVPGVGNFHACMRGLRAVGGPRLIELRLAGGRPVIGVCVGMQVLFDGSSETNVAGEEPGLGEWPGIGRPAAGGGRAAHGVVRGDRPGGVAAVRRGRARAVLLRPLLRRAEVGARAPRAPSPRSRPR